MTKEEARNMIDEHIKFHHEQFGAYRLPITDEVVSFKMTSTNVENMENDKIYVAPFRFESHTFKHLIKLIYDLEDKH